MNTRDGSKKMSDQSLWWASVSVAGLYIQNVHVWNCRRNWLSVMQKYTALCPYSLPCWGSAARSPPLNHRRQFMDQRLINAVANEMTGPETDFNFIAHHFCPARIIPLAKTAEANPKWRLLPSDLAEGRHLCLSEWWCRLCWSRVVSRPVLCGVESLSLAVNSTATKHIKQYVNQWRG